MAGSGLTFKVAGPCNVGIGGGGTIGYCERTPKVQILREFEDVMNAIGGTKIPTDRTFQGEHAIINCLFTLFDLAQWVIAKDYGNKYGSLLIQGGWTFSLSLAFPYMGTGFTFPKVELMGPDDFDEIDTTAMKQGLAFHAWPVANGDGTFQSCYSSTPT
jgi:hypothetical protein